MKSKNRKNQEGEIYLADVVRKEKPTFGSNNLILSPVGSGKTTLIKRELSKHIKGRALMLVSNTFLKDNISPDDNEKRKEMGDRTYTTKNRSVFGEGEVRLHTMSYHEFGYRIMDNDDNIKDVSHIYCDEIHSLVEYKSYGQSEGLTHALRYLFNPQEGKQIFYFTATVETLVNLKSRRPEALKYIEQFNYLDYPNIKQYINLFEEGFSHMNQLRGKIKGVSKDFKKFGYKGLIYTKTIKSMKDIEEMLIEEGMNPLVLWSINNEDHTMTEEQMLARDEIVNNNVIPEGYNFLIINNAMREGWDLFDEKVELVIINSTSETDIVQARGRARKNVAKLITRTDGVEPTDKDIVDGILKFRIINKQLTSKQKDNLVDNLGLYRSDGRQVKWNTIKKTLENNGYKVEDKIIQNNKKRVRVSIIIKIK